MVMQRYSRSRTEPPRPPWSMRASGGWVSRNLKWLSNEHFIALDPRPGRPASITLLDAGGSGGQYIRPMEEGRYVGIPVELWTQGWILTLSATALALLFALVEHQGGYDRPQGSFELGRFESPVDIAALLWVLAVLCVLLAISNLVVTVVVVGGGLVVGGLYLAYMVKFKRDIIETEPGNPNVS
jgi:hypothetical protein